MIHMHHIQKFTEKSPNVDIDYFTWYSIQRPEILNASIFDRSDLRAEERLFSKTLGVFDQMYFKLSDMQDGVVPAYLNFQENLLQGFVEETDRCYQFSISDNTVAVVIGCLKANGLLKNDKFAHLLRDLPRLTTHIRSIIQFFVVPSQLYRSKSCDIEITMQKVRTYKMLSIRDL